jgi:hypothetical protein
MRPRIDHVTLFAEALMQLNAMDPGIRFPVENPFSLDERLSGRLDARMSRLPGDAV